MSAVFKRGRTRINANLTPMIDVTFLLIVFFVLVSQIVEVESVEMDLPAPEDPATQRMSDEHRAVINVLPGDEGRAAGYRLGSREHPPGEAAVPSLATQLAALYETDPDLAVNLRADRAMHYRDVAPVLDAVQRAAALAGDVGAEPRINLVVVRED